MTKQIALLIVYNLICEEQERFLNDYSYLEEPKSDPYYQQLEEAKDIISHLA